MLLNRRWVLAGAGTAIALVVIGVVAWYGALKKENEVLKKIIGRFKADSRIAQVLVTDVFYDAQVNETMTTIKFLEFDVQGRPLEPKYFTFSGNLIQFQSLVVRFQDFYVEQADALKGKSAYLFLKVFFLDGSNTQIYDISRIRDIPSGYKISDDRSFAMGFEKAFWEKFWEYALDPEKAAKVGIKTAQIEAPGTKFVPGSLYTLKIEHDGGMRIDAQPLPDIVRGERIL
jgi:hypothetical protein